MQPHRPTLSREQASRFKPFTITVHHPACERQFHLIVQTGDYIRKGAICGMTIFPSIEHSEEPIGGLISI
jgi:hypothetical protein